MEPRLVSVVSVSPVLPLVTVMLDKLATMVAAALALPALPGGKPMLCGTDDSVGVAIEIGLEGFWFA
jgi:hypothetical protein